MRFQPGLNEDLGATMVWGTQQAGLFPGAKHDGVFGMWYGKGPGVDRCGDVFKHANAAGTSKHGGVLALAADDHACRSSTLPHGSEHEFVSAMMPVLNPAGVQDILDMGVLGWAMSRYTGRWVGFKTIAETVESSASVEVDPFAIEIATPADFEMPPGGLNIRWPDPPLDQEMRLHRYAVKAAQAFARANKLDRIVLDSTNARLGIVTTGKSYLDVLQALEVLGLDEAACRDLGIRVYKVGMTWPLEPVGIANFARGLEDIVVVEEKHAFIESQMKEQFYNFDGHRPSIVGKYDEAGEWILPSTNELTPARIARVIAARLSRFHQSERIAAQLAFLTAKEAELGAAARQLPARAALLLGLPAQHLDRGARGFARAGRHRLPLHGDVDEPRHRHLHPHGRRGRDLGRAGRVHRHAARVPEPRRRHLLPQRLAGDPPGDRRRRQHHLQDPLQRRGGDDRRPAGGRHVDRAADRAADARRGRAGDRPGQRRHRQASDPSIFPDGVSFHDRRELDAVQKQLREVKGTSILIYDQTCATEKRRRRKRGKMVDPAEARVRQHAGVRGLRRLRQEIVLRQRAAQGHRVRAQARDRPVELQQGLFLRRRLLPQLRHRARRRAAQGQESERGGPARGSSRARVQDRPGAALEHPHHRRRRYRRRHDRRPARHGRPPRGPRRDRARPDRPRAEGRRGDHARAHRARADDIHAVRVAAGEADLVLGCDMVVVNDYWALSKIRSGRTAVVINTYEAMPGTFTTRPDLEFPAADIVEAVRTALGDSANASLHEVDATRLATALMGDAIAANLFMLGHAWQQGLVPISFEALMRAIELNGAAVEMNKTAFAWGRLAAIDANAVAEAAGAIRNAPTAAEATPHELAMLGATANEAHESGLSPQSGLRDEDELRHVPAANAGEVAFLPLDDERLSRSLDELVARRVAFLADYQDAAYAKRYADFVAKVRAAEAAKAPGSTDLSEAVARYFFKLMAYKDEYEVARLYTSGEFRRRLEQQFEGD